MLAHPLTVDDPPSSIVTLGMLSVVCTGAPFAISTYIENVFFSSINKSDLGRLVKDLKKFRNIKVLRLYHSLEMIVANMLQQVAVNLPPAQKIPIEIRQHLLVRRLMVTGVDSPWIFSLHWRRSSYMRERRIRRLMGRCVRLLSSRLGRSRQLDTGWAAL